MRNTADLDLPTIIAIALIAYALANLLHEGAGHGGACVAVGGRPVALSSVHFECDDGASGTARARIVSAAGTVVNFLAALVSLALMRMQRGSPRVRYFFWLFTTINLLMAAGYFLFSGLGNIGDWAAVCRGLAPPLVWRPLLAIAGAALYYAFARLTANWLEPLIGGGADRMARASRLTIAPYVAGGLLYCVSGLFNPVGPILIAISAAAASFGGASGLLWLKEFLRNREPRVTAPLPIARSFAWILGGVAAAAIFIGILGPSIRL